MTERRGEVIEGFSQKENGRRSRRFALAYEVMERYIQEAAAETKPARSQEAYVTLPFLPTNGRKDLKL